MAENPFIPQDPQNVSIRPLNKGMIRNLPPTLIPKGAMYTVQNGLIKQGGIQKRSGSTTYMAGNQVNTLDQPIIGVAPLWLTTGSQLGCLLTNRYLYTISGYAAPSVEYYDWTVTGSTCSLTTATVTGTALTEGYQENGLTGKAGGTATGLSTTTQYYFKVNDDGNGVTEYNITTAADVTYTAVIALMNTATTGVATWSITGGDLRCTSDSATSPSTIALSAGTTGTDLFATLTDWAAFDTAVAGIINTNWDNDDVFSQVTGARGRGDYFVLDVDGSGDGPEIVEIASITDDNEIVLASSPTGTYAAGTDWAIYKRFHIEKETLLDWVVTDNKLVITDYKRTPYGYDGADLDEYDADIDYKCGCLCVLDQRLWMGNTIESGSYYRQRLRWSSATDRTSMGADDWINIDHPGSGAIRRVLPMGNLLVAYFHDGIHIGRQTNMPNLPRSFQMIETGRIGLIGARAVTGFLNGHAFVGQDDIYFLSQQGIERIGTPVIEDTIYNCAYPNKIYAAFDPINERLVFGFPGSSEEIEKIWSYNYKTKAWSYDLVSCTSLTNPLLDLDLTWEDLTDTGTGGILSANTWTGLGNDFDTWGDIRGDSSFMELFYSANGYLLKYTKDATDDNDVIIPLLIETGDMDFGVPDTDKTIRRLSLRLNKRPSAALLFTVTGSDDSGNTWKALGNLTIATDHVEGRVDFFLTGSALRLRLTSSSRAEKFTIADFTIRVIGRGLEVDSD